MVRDAFRGIGIDAWSCDLKPCERDPSWHIQGDVIEAMHSRRWDFIGLHPDCTALTVSGNHKYAAGKSHHAERLAAVEWTVNLWEMAKRLASFAYLENPRGVLSTLGGMVGYQVIQPYQFGEDASKATCLWLHGLPLLEGTEFIEPRIVGGLPRWSNQTDSGQNRLAPSATRKADRARTYPGIAEAFADQWGRHLLAA